MTPEVELRDASIVLCMALLGESAKQRLVALNDDQLSKALLDIATVVLDAKAKYEQKNKPGWH